jgi:hypothetical protein
MSTTEEKNKPDHPHGTPPGQDPDFVPGEDKPGQEKPRPDQELPEDQPSPDQGLPEEEQ